MCGGRWGIGIGYVGWVFGGRAGSGLCDCDCDAEGDWCCGCSCDWGSGLEVSALGRLGVGGETGLKKESRVRFAIAPCDEVEDEDGWFRGRRVLDTSGDG